MFNRHLLSACLVVATLTTACETMPTRAAPRPAATPTNQPTAIVEPVGQFEAIGVFSAPTQATLTFQASGRLAEVRVQEGTRIRKGDALAVLDTSELQLAVKQAQAAVAGAQAQLNQTKTPATNADTAAAQAAVDAALKNYEKVRAGPTVDDLAALKAQVDNSRAAVDQAQAAYDKVGGASNPNIGMLPQSLQLQSAFNNYKAALAAYAAAASHPTAPELAEAWQQVEQAQDALSRLEPTSDSLAAGQARVDQAQAGLELAERQLANATLIAPFDGTVLSVGPHVGETVGPSTAILTLADLNHLQMQAAVDETMLEQVQTGQTVTIMPDAFKGKTVTGQVSRIGWIGNTTAGVTNVTVTIDVDSNNIPLRPGLTATVEFGIDP